MTSLLLLSCFSLNNNQTNIRWLNLIARCHEWNAWCEDESHWDTNRRLILPKGNDPTNGPERSSSEKSLCRWRNNFRTRDNKGKVDEATKSHMKEVFGEKNDQLYWERRGGCGIDLCDEKKPTNST
jgi:hypothetical protein